MSSVIRVIGALFLTVWVAGCVVLPAQELTTFSDSLNGAKTAGDLILDEVAHAFPDSERSDKQLKSCAANKYGYRPCFRVDLALGSDSARASEPVDIKVRRLALEVIAAYAQMLADVAEGRSVKIVTARIDQLAELTTAVIGLVPQATYLAGDLPIAAIKGIVTKLETARSQSVAARSIVVVEKDIRSLIQLMINDTPALYALYVAQFRGSVKDTAVALARARVDGNADEVKRLAQKLENLRNPQGTANKPKVFEDALTKYVKLLDRTNKSIKALVEAITLSNLSPIERGTEFIRRATETRILIESLEKDLKLLRDAGR